MELQHALNTSSVGWNFDNSYARLPETWFERVLPIPVADPKMVVVNRSLGESLGLNADVLQGAEGALVFSGNQIPPGAEPIAQAYAGHQFGYFTMLGDGRAILLGEHITPDGKRLDIQLKGSGQTRFSRRGDGRAALGPMLREYIISEAMHALGIPTTRSLAVVSTGEPVYREIELPGAILTRVASSHIRVGTFEYIAAQHHVQGIRTLVEYTIDRHYPDLHSAENPSQALLNAVIEKQALLVAQWQLVGFIHGVMNTDNMALSGETIDYGPCAFMDTYDPATVFSSIDQHGRYAYANQPLVAQWNLARFAETLLPFLHPDQARALKLAEESIETFADRFNDHWLSGMRRKLGLFTRETEDLELGKSLLTEMHRLQADYTNTFRDLTLNPISNSPLFQDPAFVEWLNRWQARLNRQPQSKEQIRQLMQSSNPVVIPRNHRVEEALKAAAENHDYSVLDRLLRVLSRPFDTSPEHDLYGLSPEPSQQQYKTFCGT